MHRRFLSPTALLLGLTLVALAARVAFLVEFDNVFSHEGESYSKINLVRTWLANGKPYPDINFGPLHTWLIYALVTLFGGWIWPVRVFGVVAATATVPLVFGLVKNRFDERTAWVATILFAFFPTHLRASPTGLAEVPYLLAFVAGLLAFFVAEKDRRRARWGAAALAAALLAAAGMLRFEAWLFFPVLCLLMWRRSFRLAAFFGALSAIFPLVHMGMSWKTTGNPLSFAQTSALSFLQYMPELPLRDKALGWMQSFGIGMGYVAGVLAVVGVVVALARRQRWELAALIGFPLAVMQYKALTNTMDPSLERYIVSLATLLFAYAAYALVALADRVGRRRPSWRNLALIVAATLAVWQFAWAWRQAEANQYDVDIRRVVEWLKTQTGPDDRVLPDQRFHPFLQIESGLPLTSFVDLRWAADRKSLDENAFADMIATAPPTIVILDYFLDGVDLVNSNLDVFSVPRDAAEAEDRGLHFRRVFADGNFVVFRTRPSEVAP